jgi:hypothetical protein
LQEVGEEFVEFLEQELGIDEKESKQRTERRKGSSSSDGNATRTKSSHTSQEKESVNKTDGAARASQQKQSEEKEKGTDIDELLASLKKEMGL